MLKHSQTHVSTHHIPMVMVVRYPDWPTIFMRSLRRFCKNFVLIVNHLPNGGTVESSALIGNTKVISHLNTPNPNPHLGKGLGELSHGMGIDLAVNYLKDNGFKSFVHVEPDCLVTGIDWLKEIAIALADGYHMAGSSQLSYGPIHVCPTGWNLDFIADTFDVTLIDQSLIPDPKHFDFIKLVKWCLDVNVGHRAIWFLCSHWDTGFKNWYIAASKNKAKVTSGNGFIHFTNGSNRPPDQLPKEVQYHISCIVDHGNIDE